MAANPQGRLMERAAKQAAVPAERPRTLNDQINGMVAEVAKVLPAVTTPERLARVTLTSIRQTPALAKCSVPSLLGAMLNCAQTGLEPGPGDYVYLVPRWNKKVGQDECVWTLGYKGILELARRNGVDVIARTVHENDTFEVWTDEHGDHVNHRPALRQRGDAIGYYAVARGDKIVPLVHYMPREEIERHRAASDAGESKFGPWVNWFDSMARKTVVRQMAPYLPLSVEMRQALAQDDGVRTDLSAEGIEMDARHQNGPAEEAPSPQEQPPTPPPALPPAADDDLEVIDADVIDPEPGDDEPFDDLEPDDDPEAVSSSGSEVVEAAEPAPAATPTVAGAGSPLPPRGDGEPLDEYVGRLTIAACRSYLRYRHVALPTPVTLPKMREAVLSLLIAEDPL